MFLQKEHQVADFPLFMPGRADVIQGFSGHTLDLKQLFRGVFNDVKDAVSKTGNKALRHNRANALDHA